MSTIANTEHQKYYFKASQYTDGTPFISTEPVNQELSILKNKNISFNLSEQISFAEAQEIAVFLNNKIDSISIVHFVEE